MEEWLGPLMFGAALLMIAGEFDLSIGSMICLIGSSSNKMLGWVASHLPITTFC